MGLMFLSQLTNGSWPSAVKGRIAGSNATVNFGSLGVLLLLRFSGELTGRILLWFWLLRPTNSSPDNLFQSSLPLIRVGDL